MTKPDRENNQTALVEPQIPLVSVCVITYNHAQYIVQTLKSILMQKTNFAFEIVIGEDKSTDNTRAICAEFAEKHANIRLLATEGNVGVVPNFIRTANACRGKYIAVLEGDDYWIDNLKLQKQADALDEDPARILCFTSRKDYGEETKGYTTMSGDRDSTGNRFYLEDFARETFFHLSTVLFRKPETPQYFDRFEAFKGLYDRPLYISLLSDTKGYAYKLKDICSVYRLNNTSTFTPIGAMKRTLMVADMYAQIKVLHPELSNYLNHHLNKFDYFIMRDAYQKADKTTVKKLARQIIARPTIAAGWWLKSKAFFHLLV
jgi:glycosyltransferase involved in cell wall biosynthesis